MVCTPSNPMNQTDSRNVIFLDFDGVLHPTPVPYAQMFCRMPILMRAVEGFDCVIVISSSWRHYFEIEKLLGRFPESLRSRIVGCTGDVETGKWPRYQEIQNYVRDHAISDWRALDDSFMEFPENCPQLLLCDPTIGMDDQHVDAIRKWLKQ